MLNVIVKTAVIYLIVILTMRLMGKKQAAQLQPYEFVITLMISEVASTPMDSPGTPILYGLIPALTLLLLYYALSFLSLKSKRVRVLLCGKPTILIHDGKLMRNEIVKLNYSLNDLMEQLRLYGETNISNIHYGILETNGQLSVLLYSAEAPIKPSQMDLEVENDDLSSALIMDGKFNVHGLMRVGINQQQFTKILHTLGFSDPKDVFLLTLSTIGEVFIQDKSGNTKNVRLNMEGVRC